MPWFGIIAFAALGTLAYSIYKSMKGSSGGLPGIPSSTITQVVIDSSTPAGDMGHIALSPSGTLNLQVYAPPANYQWIFGCTDTGCGLLASPGVLTSAGTASFAWASGGGKGGRIYASLVRIGGVPLMAMAMPPLATYSMQVDAGVY